jgi:hypothetical protein
MKLKPTKIDGWSEMVMLPESKTLPRSEKQFRKLPRKVHGNIFVEPVVRWDDSCGNGHNTFSVTATLFEENRYGGLVYVGGGCCHDIIEKSHPEIKHLIHWHLCSSDGPWGYLGNTEYHALQHGPKYAWVYYKGPSASDPLSLGDDGVKKRLLGYLKTEEAQKAVGVDGYEVEWDMKTVKVRNLDHARSSACWPEATDEQLCLPPNELKTLLIERLPELMIQMYEDITDFGFEY